MTALRELFASFYVDFDKEGALEKGDKQVSGLAEKLVGLGKSLVTAFAVEQIVEFGKELLNEAVALSRTAQALGANTDELEKLEYAAQRSGLEVDELHGALARMQRVAAQAAEGKGADKTFEKLGISLKGADGQVKTSGVLFTEIADKIKAIQSPTERAGVASEIFGRSYARLLPLLLKGGDGIAQLGDEFEQLGAGMDEAFIQNSKQILGSISRIKTAIRGFWIQAIGPALPDIAKFAQNALDVVKAVVVWVRHTKLIAAATTAFGLTAIGGLLRSIPALIVRMGGLRAALHLLSGFALRTVLPFLALEDVIVFLSGGKSLLGEGLEKAFGADKTEGFRQSLLGLPGQIGPVIQQLSDGLHIFIAGAEDLFDWLFGYILKGFRAVGTVLGALGFKQAERDIKLGADIEGAAHHGGHLADEQDREAVRNIKQQHDDAEKKQGKTLSLESFIPQGAYTPERENAIRAGLGLALKQTSKERDARGGDWRDAYMAAQAKGSKLSPEEYVAQNAPRGTSDQDIQYLIKALSPRSDLEGLRGSLAQYGIGAIGKPGGGAIELSDESAKALGATFAESATAALQASSAGGPLMSVAPPQQLTQDINVRNQITNQIAVAPGTTDDQARDLASAATAGTKKGIDTKQLRAALVPTTGGA